MQCPFIYANGKRCKGYVKFMKLIKANIELKLDENGKIIGFHITPNHRYHVHLYCSEKGSHSGAGRQHDWRMKVWWNDLPEEFIEEFEKIQKPFEEDLRWL